jgi:hypothetical protein
MKVIKLFSIAHDETTKNGTLDKRTLSCPRTKVKTTISRKNEFVDVTG